MEKFKPTSSIEALAQMTLLRGVSGIAGPGKCRRQFSHRRGSVEGVFERATSRRCVDLLKKRLSGTRKCVRRDLCRRPMFQLCRSFISSPSLCARLLSIWKPWPGLQLRGRGFFQPHLLFKGYILARDCQVHRCCHSNSCSYSSISSGPMLFFSSPYWGFRFIHSRVVVEKDVG